VPPLDAQKVGIQQLQFALDARPPTGLSLSISYVVEENCSAERYDCVEIPGFFSMDEAGQPRQFDESGANTFNLADFAPGPGSAIGASLDRTRVVGIQFNSRSSQTYVRRPESAVRR
jgi:hypothetical protein